jgi:hypothetical protein
MLVNVFQNWNLTFSRTQLVTLRLKAKRTGVWFRALSRIDRVLVDLTIMVADNVKSTTLTRNLQVIIRKLETILQDNHLRFLMDAASRQAQKLSLLAQRWGNVSAGQWVNDASFVLFLAVMRIHTPKTFKT